MSLFDAAGLVTARQAAELYGIRWGPGGRAFCPFHDDGRHPALSFRDGRYICPTCEIAADSIKVELVMRMAIADKSPNVPKCGAVNP